MFSNVFPLRYVLFDSTSVLPYNHYRDTCIRPDPPKKPFDGLQKYVYVFNYGENKTNFLLFFLRIVVHFFVVVSFKTLDINSKTIYNQMLLAYKRFYYAHILIIYPLFATSVRSKSRLVR